jgi:hypothetical protein
VRAAGLSAAEEELVMWRNATDVFRL